jgi:hypothetical protein
VELFHKGIIHLKTVSVGCIPMDQRLFRASRHVRPEKLGRHMPLRNRIAFAFVEAGRILDGRLFLRVHLK